MSYTNGLDKPSDYFNTVLYTGNGTTQSITGVGFQPDWIWIKGRNSAQFHTLFDSVRGVNKRLFTNSTDAESTATQMTSFDSDGFSVSTGGGSFDSTNGNSITFASWNWLAGGTASSNTSGSITSTVSANTTSGFSIVSWTGTGATATVGHGLGATPEVVIVKRRDTSGTDWITWGSILGGTVGSEFIKLNTTGAKTTGLNSSWFNNTAPDSDVFTVGTQSDLNASAATYIGYCFKEIKGYSKFGLYTGNGSTDGTFVYTGFTPAFVIRKRTDATNSWVMFDNKRPEYNVRDKRLAADISDAEASGNTNRLDLLSNGFKNRGTATGSNGSGASYIYMAFASNPFVTSTGVPATAR